MALPLLRRNDDDVRARPTPGAPAGWEPRRELEELRDRLDRLMDSLWQPTDETLGSALGWAPAVDVEEADDAWIVEAELPGIKEKDIGIELHGTELSISGDIAERKRRGILRRSSRRVGRFDYRVNLPGISDTEEVRATLDQGVLTVRVPKPEHAKRRRIQIQKG
ncbi:MAG TPA: Hsp20/alpha crystallin family protein [Solirubrobacteraceae bacterium]|nr:Hsp20/alpha crystallin family protein [Solirubrobacteraceae bacterium]